MEFSTNQCRIFDQVIHEINREHITPRDEIVRMYKDSFNDFFNSFHGILKQNDPLLASYRQIHYAGSTNENLVVGTYKEFDMDILIKLPPSSRKIKVNETGTVKIMLNNLSGITPDKERIMKKWIDTDDAEKHILPDKFRSWGQSLVDRSFNALEYYSAKKLLRGSRGNYLLKTRMSGPAFVVEVESLENDIQFNVNIAFCLYFEEWQESFPNINIKNWLAVPKTPNQFLNTGYKNWRYSFPETEKNLLSYNEHMKSTIKLIKKFRDTHDLNFLPSYYIKTLFLWEAEKRGHAFWTNNYGYLFVTMLMELKNAVENNSLPFYWKNSLNLFDSLSANQLYVCKMALRSALNKIESYCRLRQPNSLKEILLGDEEHEEPEYNDAGPSHSLQQETSSSGNAMMIGAAAAGIAAVLGGLFLYNRNRDN